MLIMSFNFQNESCKDALIVIMMLLEKLKSTNSD